MKKTVFKLCFIAFLGLTISCSEDNIENEVIEETQNFNQELLSSKQINDEIKSVLQQTGQFYWKDASLQMLWSASQHGQNIITIGYGTTTNDFEKSNANKSSSIEKELLAIIANNESNPSEKTVIYNDPVLNIIDVVVKDQKTLYALRKNINVRYVEPGDYRFFQFEEENGAMRSSSSGSSGCGFDSETLSTSDYTSISPNAKVPWSFYKHNIPSAWNKSTGSGITIGVIDSGVSPNQSLMGSNFNNGYSSGRSVQKYGTYVDSIWPWSSSTDGRRWGPASGGRRRP